VATRAPIRRAESGDARRVPGHCVEHDLWAHFEPEEGKSESDSSDSGLPIDLTLR